MALTAQVAATYTTGALLISAENTRPTTTRRFPPLSVADRGKVRLGGQGPCFRPVAIADAGKVRIGGQGPIFR